MTKTKPIPFSRLITALLDDQTPFPPRYLHRFSDLAPEDTASLIKVWPRISPARRVALMEDLDELNQADDLLSFEDVCTLALQDPLPDVRRSAVMILRNYEQVQFLSDFLRMAKQDVDSEVRAAATTALSAFIYMGEVDELQPSTLNRVEECLLSILNGQDETLTRRRALEAMGYSSRPEVYPAIEKAYASNDPDWLSSALNAIGRSADKAWKSKVVAMFDHPHPIVRAEAASAAGELEIKSAVPALLRMLRDPDLDVRMAAIWSLSQIGGKGVRPALEKQLKTTEDDAEAEQVENALENLDFTEDLLHISLLDITDVEDEEDEIFSDDELDDLEDEGDSPA